MATPNPTIEELREFDSLVNGDVSLAVLEMVVRLQELLPGYIADKNQRKGWTTPVQQIPTLEPDSIAPAPFDLTNVERNGVYIAISIRTTPEGVGAYKNIGDIRIWSVQPRASTWQQIMGHFRRAECIRTCLMPFLTGCDNADDQTAWKLLEPTGIEIIGDRKEYSGTRLTYTLVQSPNLGYS